MARKALGKGLEALITEADETATAPAREVLELPIAQIERSRLQPRTDFDPAKLDELARSIKERGVIQPVTVRRRDGAYELVAGERRVLAAKAAGFETVPALVIEATDEEALQLALIENIQRDDLNPIEHAHAYRTLANQFNLTQEQIAQRVGKDRASVANYLRLLLLPEKIQGLIATEQITFGHARALLGAATPARQQRLARRVVEEGLSVREVERLVAGGKPVARPKPLAQQAPKDVHIAELEHRLRQALATKVSVIPRKKGGRIEIQYYSLEDLDRILSHFDIK